MRKIFILFSLVLSVAAGKANAQLFWTENFESGSLAGMQVSAYSGPNGPWALTITGTEGAKFNPWYVSCAEAGHTVGGCGTNCATSLGLGATLHIGSNPTTFSDLGASYDAGGLYNTTTDRRAESPTINCSGRYTITLKFYYTMDGQAGVDYATVWYYDGTTWTMISTPPQTPPICPGGQGYWDAISLALPPSANNNPNVKIGFRWVNNNDGVGTDPSIAFDSVSLRALTTTLVPTPSFSVTPSYVTCQDSCITFTNTSTGPVDSFTWSSPGVTISSPHASPVSICFSVVGTHSVTLTDYHGGTAYPSSHAVTVNPTPHPVIHYTGSHTLSVTGTYTSYQWLNGSSIIPGATNSTYVAGTSGTYTVVVDSGGCYGYATPFVFSTLQNYQVEQVERVFWLSQSAGGSTATIFCSQAPAEDLNVAVYDGAGRLCGQDIWRKGSIKTELNIADLPAGFFVVRITGAGTYKVLKMLK